MREVVERARNDGGDGEDFCDVRTACHRYYPILPDEVIINGGLLMPIKCRKACARQPRVTFGPGRLTFSLASRATRLLGRSLDRSITSKMDHLIGARPSRLPFAPTTR